MYPKCYSTLTHNKLIVCCVSVAWMHSNINVYGGAAFLFFGGAYVLPNAPERNCQGLVDWLSAPCHYEVWSKKQELPHFFGWKLGPWWMLAYACSAHTVENWKRWKSGTTSKGNTKSSNLWLDSFHQMEQKIIFSEALYVHHPTK